MVCRRVTIPLKYFLVCEILSMKYFGAIKYSLYVSSINLDLPLQKSFDLI